MLDHLKVGTVVNRLCHSVKGGSLEITFKRLNTYYLNQFNQRDIGGYLYCLYEIKKALYLV